MEEDVPLPQLFVPATVIVKVPVFANWSETLLVPEPLIKDTPEGNVHV